MYEDRVHCVVCFDLLVDVTMQTFIFPNNNSVNLHYCKVFVTTIKACYKTKKKYLHSDLLLRVLPEGLY